jgi:hypothetical protein
MTARMPKRQDCFIRALFGRGRALIPPFLSGVGRAGHWAAPKCAAVRRSGDANQPIRQETLADREARQPNSLREPYAACLVALTRVLMDLALGVQTAYGLGFIQRPNLVSVAGPLALRGCRIGGCLRCQDVAWHWTALSATFVDSTHAQAFRRGLATAGCSVSGPAMHWSSSVAGVPPR